MKHDVPEMMVKPTTFVDDLLDTAANLNPVVLMTILVGIFGCLLAVAPLPPGGSACAAAG